MQVHTNGYLYWDEVPNATGYTVKICDSIGYNCKSFISNTNSYDIITPMNNMKKDSAYYRFEVAAKGVSGSDIYESTTYYYTSPFDKLDSPANIRWINDNIVGWNPVPNATSYIVAVFTPYGSVDKVTTVTDPTINLNSNGYTVNDNTWIRIQAKAANYRSSENAESPIKGGRDTESPQQETYEIHDATKNTNVTITATPTSGYEFVE